MAFDSTSSISLSKPVIVFRVTDWAVNTTLSKPTLIFNLNWAVNSELPIVTAIGYTPSAYSVSITLSKPTLSSSSVSDNLINLNYTLKKPEITFDVNILTTNQVAYILPKPTVSCSLASDIVAHLNTRLSPIVLSFTSVLTATTIKQTWVFNTITTAHSRYTNFDFNSFFKLGSNNYGINANGSLYKLTGLKDFAGESNEADINSEIILPATTFDEQTLKSCSDAIIYGRGDGYMEVQVVLDEQQKRTGYMMHFDNRVGMHRNRVKIPKGLKGNVWQFILKNVKGSYFDINMFEVFVKTMQRLKW